MGRFLLWLLILPLTLGATRLGEPRLLGEPPAMSGRQWYISAGGDLLVAPGAPAPTVNLWQLAASRWLDGVGLLLLIGWLIGLRSVVRLWRLRHRVRQTHCQTCDYDLRGCTGTRCPECGEDLVARPGITGWPVGGPIATRLSIMLAALAVWLPLWLVASPYKSWNGPEWLSDGVYDWAKRKNVQWMLDRVVQAQAAERIDVATGKPVRVLTRSAKPMLSWCPVRPLRDTRYVMVVFEKHIEIRQSSDGALLRTLVPPDRRMHISDAFDTDAGVLCAEVGDRTTLRWNWRDGTPLGSVWHSESESYGWFIGAGDQKLIKTRDGELAVVDVLGKIVRRFDQPARRKQQYSDEWFSHDHQWLLRLTRRTDTRIETPSGKQTSRTIIGPRVEIWDVPSGAFMRDIVVGDDIDDIAMDSRKKLIFVTRSNPTGGATQPLIEAYDTTTGDPAGAVTLPGAGSISNLLVKTNGATLVITAETSAGSGVQVWEIPILYDD